MKLAAAGTEERQRRAITTVDFFDFHSSVPMLKVEIVKLLVSKQICSNRARAAPVPEIVTVLE
jgi:hypothetical protein